MSPFLDDRGRLFGKVNMVDLLVIVALVALAVFAFVRFSGGGDGQESTIRTTFVVERIRESSFLQLHEGDEVREETGTLLGTIERAEISPNPVEVPTDDGDLLDKPSPIFNDAQFVVRGSGHVSASKVRIGNVPLLVGRFLVLRGPSFELRAQIRRVEW